MKTKLILRPRSLLRTKNLPWFVLRLRNLSKWPEFYLIDLSNELWMVQISSSHWPLSSSLSAFWQKRNRSRIGRRKSISLRQISQTNLYKTRTHLLLLRRLLPTKMMLTKEAFKKKKSRRFCRVIKFQETSIKFRAESKARKIPIKKIDIKTFFEFFAAHLSPST